MAQAALVPIILAAAPFLAAVLGYLTPLALQSLAQLLQGWREFNIWQKLSALRHAREVARSSLSSPQVQQASNITAAQAFAVDAVLEGDYARSMDTLALEYAATTFATRGLLDEAATELTIAYESGLISEANWALAVQHGQAEVWRLAGVTLPVVIPVPVAPTVPVAIPAITVPTPYISTEPIAGAMERGLAGVGQALAGIAPALAGVLPMVGTMMATGLLSASQEIGHRMSQGRTACMSTTGLALAAQLLPKLSPLALMAFMEQPAVAEAITNPITNRVFEALFTIPEMAKPITPDDAPTLARKLFGRAVGLGLGAHVAAQMAEAYTPLKHMGLGFLAAFLADSAGFSRIAAATMGVVETQALRVPMGYYLNARIRSLLPNTREAMQLLGQRQITRAQFDQLLAYNGMAPEYVQGYAQLAYRPPAPRILQQIADAGIYDEVYFRHALEASQYDEATVTQVLSMLYSRAHGALSTLMVGTAIKRYKEGFDNEAALATNLQMLAVKPALLPKYLYAARLERDYDDFMDYLSAVKGLVEKGVIDPPDMVELLVSKGQDRAKAALLGNIEAVKRIKKVGVAYRDTSLGLTAAVAERYITPEPKIRPVSIGLLGQVPERFITPEPKIRESSVGLTISVARAYTTPEVTPRPTSIGLIMTVRR